MRIHYPLLALLTSLVGTAGLMMLLARPAAPAVAATGSLRFVDGNGLPLAGQKVRVLCYSTPAAGAPLADLPVQTGGDGTVVSSLPAGCNYIAALRLRHTQPSGKPGHGPAYWLYATSWVAGSSTPVLAAGDIAIYDDRPLVLFNVVASLAWQPPAGSPYLAQLQDGLRAASAYLYDLSEGQMAFGPVTIHTAGRGWEGADLRFLAANDYRPLAYMGGMVAAPLAYTTAGGTDTVYAPGAVYLGRYWDGLEASNPFAGNWSQPAAFQTIGHEWGHYALFLYDEYQQGAAAGREETYCVCLELPGGLCGNASAMSYHYNSSELWLPADHGLPAECLQTDQWLMHGEADWPTLERWAAIQGYTFTNWLNQPTSLTSGPALGLAAHLYGRPPAYRLFLPAAAHSTGSPPPAAVALTISLSIEGNLGLGIRNRLYPQFYTLAGSPACCKASTANLSYQGTSNNARSTANSLGQISLPGVGPAELGRLYVERYSTMDEEGGRFVYPPAGGSDPLLINDQSLTLAADTWQASLDVRYGMEGPLLRTMTVTLISPAALATPPVLQRCSPDAAVGCQAQTMTAANATTWLATYQAPAGMSLPAYGLLHVRAAGVGELSRWFQSLGGVGPGHMDGFAPLRDGSVMVDAMGAIPGPTNRVVAMPAAHYPAITAPLPAGVETIVGVPFDLDIILPNNPPQTGGDQTLATPVALTLFYSQAAVDRLGVPENQLRLLHYRRNLNQWVNVPVSGRSNTLNWLAAVGLQEDGIYAVGWGPGQPPQADFSAFPQNGPAPLPVSFTNLSEGDYSSSLWDFGDGNSSPLQNPQHLYQMPGTYTVTLTVAGPGGSDVEVRPNFIVVLPGR